MHVIQVKHPHDGLWEGVQYLKRHGYQRDSRNGPVLQSPVPVTTQYGRPQERVVFWPSRDANPFFHLMEALWMLAGRWDVKFVKDYVKRMEKFSSNGTELWGAYGKRWRSWFGHDQIEEVVLRLRENPNDRRTVIQMWDAVEDIDEARRNGPDVPCNLIAVPQIGFDGSVDLTVFCRSNDIVWGAYGANAVHFSVLLEYLAAGIGRPMGRYYQVSVNYHGYVDTLPALDGGRYRWTDPYSVVNPTPLFNESRERWDDDLGMFMSGRLSNLRTRFFRRVAVPMRNAWQAFKESGSSEACLQANNELEAMPEKCDWKVACSEWLARRYAERLKKEMVGS